MIPAILSASVGEKKSIQGSLTLVWKLVLEKENSKFQLLWNSRGISVHAFEFSLAENLSAQHMGWLGVRLKQVLTRMRAGGWRCHSDVITVRDDTGWQGAGDVTHRKHVEVCVRIWGKKESGFRRQTRRIDFGARRREANVRPMGAARVGGQMNKTA